MQTINYQQIKDLDMYNIIGNTEKYWSYWQEDG